MMSEEALKAAIVGRIFKVLENCNRSYSNHQRGVIRGMVWALTGDDPGDPEDATETLSKIGVPFRASRGEFLIDLLWLQDHGFGPPTDEDMAEWEELNPSRCAV